ncbi:hypothetical protein ON010_g7700 [Phytophthora cinnamomi]|nr:hypothetical protein ON010_g7700 [Phytophthora cinnamomi]
MSLTRRNVGQGAESSEDRGRRGSTIWEDEADEYWKKMEPAQRCRRITNYLAALVAVVLLGGGVFYGARTALDLDNIAALKARFSSPQVSTPQNLTNVAEPAPASVSMPMPTAPAVPVQTSESLGQEAQRGRCRRPAQRRVHERLLLRVPHGDQARVRQDAARGRAGSCALPGRRELHGGLPRLRRREALPGPTQLVCARLLQHRAVRLRARAAGVPGPAGRGPVIPAAAGCYNAAINHTLLFIFITERRACSRP